PVPARECPGARRPCGRICMRRAAGNRRTGAQGDDRGPRRWGPAGADGRGVLLHTRPGGDAGEPHRGAPLEPHTPDALLCRRGDLPPGGRADGHREEIRDRGGWVKAAWVLTQWPYRTRGPLSVLTYVAVEGGLCRQASMYASGLVPSNGM